MSFLRDFAGSFLTAAGNEGMRREDEDRQLRLQDALERRRRRYQQEDALQARQWRNEDAADQLAAAGPAPGYDDQGKYGMLRSRGEVDPETGRLRVTRERVADAPRVPNGRPYEVKIGGEIRTFQRYTDNTEEEIGRAPRQQLGGGSGRSDRPVTRTRYDENDPSIEIKEERVNGEWVEYSRAPRWKPDGKDGAKPQTAAARGAAGARLAKFNEAVTKAKTTEAAIGLLEQYGIDTDLGLTKTEEGWFDRGRLLTDDQAKAKIRAKAKSFFMGNDAEPEGREDPAALAAARAAIAAGAKPEDVKARLKQNGISTRGL